MKRLLFIVFLILIACGRSSNNPEPMNTLDMRAQVAQRVQELRPLALVCENDVAKDIEDPVSNECNDGDNTAFLGMNCLAGDKWACENAHRAFDGRRFWRSARRVGLVRENDFSRDMFLGALMYLAATKDVSVAKAYRKFLHDNNGRLCNTDTDGRCSMTPQMWNLFYHVLKYLDVAPISITDGIIDWTMDRALIKQAQEVPLGYQLELVAENVLIRQFVGTYTSDLRSVARILMERHGNNPLYLYIRDGFTDNVGALYLQRCKSAGSGPRVDWLWASPTSELDNLSMIWDCNFLGNLLLR
jgi:hypothetical protein